MRVIGGSLRGRKLTALQGRAVRPTADRVKEAIFNIIGTKTDDARVLDLFAGTGALGIEALSRNAKTAVFVDSAGASLKVIQKNLALCRLTPVCRVIKWNIAKNLKPLLAEPSRFDLIFLDPPYNRGLILPTLDHIASHHLATPDAVVVVEHDPLETIARDLESWRITDSRRYGQTQVTFLTLVMG